MKQGVVCSGALYLEGIVNRKKRKEKEKKPQSQQKTVHYLPGPIPCADRQINTITKTEV